MHNCPCCGFSGLEYRPYARLTSLESIDDLAPPYCQFFGDPSYEVCTCCGFEFGNDDEPGTGAAMSFKEYRIDWIKRGCPWFTPSQRPKDWNLSKQLRAAGLRYP